MVKNYQRSLKMIKYDFQNYTLKCKDNLAAVLLCETITTGKGTIAVYLRPMKDPKGGIIKRVYRNGDYQITLKFQIPDDFDFSTLVDVMRIADSSMLAKNFVVKDGPKW